MERSCNEFIKTISFDKSIGIPYIKQTIPWVASIQEHVEI
jgi:hypothetical protein